ncbi:disease resistance protein RPS2-like [Beta vulgaris subsp. vulgaris]|uniref:disease resistance protein RPS2-like n=1 Tax=Beta vulgaris subsp. vulgaris TaxID=3555 RepID=UPI0025479AD0|nr:disease resistance protein RPS2-like [Beta vulgaris subsp. vulgaris]
MEDDVLRILQYSYDRLNDEMVQNCFLSCILYPEDEDIERETLIELWINEGLLDEKESKEDQVAKGHTILNKLVNWCLLESTFNQNQQKCVKMHDLIRDMAIKMTKESPRFIAKSRLMLKDVPGEEQWSKDLKKVSLSYNRIKEIPCGMAPVTPHLTVLLLSHNKNLNKIPESFFMHMRSLTVLDLSHTKIESLPESVSNLENLRALLLKGCHALSEIQESFFMHMRSLTVLDLSDTRIKSLPDSVFNLENLRALLLERCYHLEYLPSVAKLTKLRVLKFDTERDIDPPYNKCGITPEGIESLNLKMLSFDQWIVFDDLIRFNRLIESWQGCDELYWNCLVLSGEKHKLYHDEDVVYLLLFCRNHKIVTIKSMVFDVEYKDELPILLLPSTTTGLNVKNIRALKHQSLGNLLPSLAGTEELRYLWLEKCEGLEYILASEAAQLDSVIVPSLDSLEYLWLKRMPDLRGLSNSISVSTLSRIKHLFMKLCPNIKVLFPRKLLQHDETLFPFMETLEVEECDELEEIFEGGGRYSSCSQSEKVRMLDPNASSPNSNSILVHLPKLRELYLGQLPKLKRIHAHLHLYPSLVYLNVEDCPEIQQIFEASQPTLALPKLRELFLKNLPKLSSIYRGLLLCTSLRWLTAEKCLKLKRLPLFSLSEHLICDASPSALLSLPMDFEDPELWEFLRSKYPEDARLLSAEIRSHQKHQLKRKRETALSLSLSSPLQ